MPFLRICLLFSFVLAAAFLAPAQDAGQNRWQVASPNGQIVFVLANGGQISDHPPCATPLISMASGCSMKGSSVWISRGWRRLVPACTPAQSRVAQMRPIPSRSVRQRRSATTTTPWWWILRVNPEPGYRLRCERSTTGWLFAMSCPSSPPVKSVHITAERTQFRYSKDATLYPLVVSGFQSSYEDNYR